MYARSAEDLLERFAISVVTALALELLAFERREREFLKKERQERAAQLQIPVGSELHN
jgi:hypothetical protein